MKSLFFAGLMLYVLYKNDIPTSSATLIGAFADDTIIMTYAINPAAASQNLQEHLDKIADWTNKWQIKIIIIMPPN